MAWTAPFTAVVGTIIQASDWNTSGRDNLLYLQTTVENTTSGHVHNGTDSRRLAMAYVSKAFADSPYTVPGWGYHVDVDASGGAVTVNLPTAVGNAGALIEVRKTDSSANTVTVDGSGTETINGAATLVIYAQYDSYSLRSNGANVGIV